MQNRAWTASRDTENVVIICIDDREPPTLLLGGGWPSGLVRALDWRPCGPGFESRCGNFASEL